MAQSRKFASHRTAVDGIAEQLLDELAHMVALGIEQRAFVFLEKSGELPNVGGVGRDSERRQTLLDLQIVEEPVELRENWLAEGTASSMRVIGR